MASHAQLLGYTGTVVVSALHLRFLYSRLATFESICFLLVQKFEAFI
jgi:hypothetical protein